MRNGGPPQYPAHVLLELKVESRYHVMRCFNISFLIVTGLCSTPAVKLNSRVSISSEELTEGTVAQYSCDPGFIRLG